MITNYLDSTMREAEKLRDKLNKVIELTVTDPPDVKIGTSPYDVVFTENKLRLLHYRPSHQLHRKGIFQIPCN